MCFSTKLINGPRRCHWQTWPLPGISAPPPATAPHGGALKEKSNPRLIEAVVTSTSCPIDGGRDNGSTGVTDRKPAAAAESSPPLARPQLAPVATEQKAFD